jgi:hypothetical protein
MRVGSRIVFWAYEDEIGRSDPIFQPGDFGVVVAVEDEAVKCLLTDECGVTMWWNGDTLFAGEFLHLAYAPIVPPERLPVPYGTMIGEPH